MKKLTTAVFPSRESAEAAINALNADLQIPADDISYIYRNSNDDVQEVNLGEVEGTSDDAMAEGAAAGALTGGALGAIAGIATVAGLIPVIGPIFAAGSVFSALGIGLGTGAVGTTVAAAATGAAAGGVIGALTNVGVPRERAQEYEDRVAAGDILVAVHSEDTLDVARTLEAHGAMSIDAYTPTI